MRHVVLVLALLLLAAPASAQYRTNSSWLGVHGLGPVEEADDLYDRGFGITAASRWVRTVRFDWTLEAGYFHLPGQDRDVGEIDDVNTITVLFGGLLDYGVFAMGVKGGYYFVNLHEWDAVPTAELAFRRVAVGAEYKAFGTTKWVSVFVRYRW